MDLPRLAKSLRRLPGWEHVRTPADFSLERMGGALTNLVFRCATRGASDDVLVRVYGKGTDRLFSRDREIAACRAISRSGMGPRILLEFEGGRVETWVAGAAPFAPEQVRDGALSSRVARHLACFHRVPRGGSGLCDGSIAFDRARAWLDLALSACEPPEASRCRLGEMDADLCALRARLPPSPLVFGHNDLQHGNILLSARDLSVTFVDFEYAGPVERGFDIGNHWCEWGSDFGAGGAAHRDLFPSAAERRDFCAAYLNVSPLTDAVQSLCDEATAWSTLSHAWWGLWALVRAPGSAIDFDYVSYARQRLDRYWSLRESPPGGSA